MSGPTARTLGEMTPQERAQTVRRAAQRFQAELSSTAAAIGAALQAPQTDPLPVGTRHYCPNRDKSWAGASHIRGDGVPKRKRCHCGAALAVETGCYGVFAWRADARYPAALAVHVARTSRQAAAWIAANPGHGYVDRWISHP